MRMIYEVLEGKRWIRVRRYAENKSGWLSYQIGMFTGQAKPGQWRKREMKENPNPTNPKQEDEDMKKKAKDNLENATARPWKVVHFEMSHESEVSNGVKIVSCENGDTIADNETYYPHAITEPNAALIVRAVNSHDALVEAVEEAFTVIGEGMIDNCLTEEELPVYEALMAKLETALKLAKGE